MGSRRSRKAIGRRHTKFANFISTCPLHIAELCSCWPPAAVALSPRGPPRPQRPADIVPAKRPKRHLQPTTSLTASPITDTAPTDALNGAGVTIIKTAATTILTTVHCARDASNSTAADVRLLPDAADVCQRDGGGREGSGGICDGSELGGAAARVWQLAAHAGHTDVGRRGHRQRRHARAEHAVAVCDSRPAVCA